MSVGFLWWLALFWSLPPSAKHGHGKQGSQSLITYRSDSKNNQDTFDQNDKPPTSSSLLPCPVPIAITSIPYQRHQKTSHAYLIFLHYGLVPYFLVCILSESFRLRNITLNLGIKFYFTISVKTQQFSGGGALEHWKVLLVTMVCRQETFLNSRRSRMAKTLTFWPWWQPFSSFCFETVSFLHLFHCSRTSIVLSLIKQILVLH